jgi:hypothetical protein
LGVDRPFFDVAAAQQVLVNSTSHCRMEDALGLSVVPQQIVLVASQFVHSALACAIRAGQKNNPALGRVKSDDGGSRYAERCGIAPPSEWYAGTYR